ncbi:MAG: GvpL/GvpF family gas vesicle protein [Verrucomicrobia bacterium]|nr:GvpL/GvpF family gas vesicle protein [Verrucomicrobiota bacterium]
MSENAENLSGRYLYAVISVDDAWPENEANRYGDIGLNDSKVYCIIQESIAAVVSNVRETKFRPERRHLAAHHQTLQALMRDELTMLPVSFGVVAEDLEALRKLLVSNEDTFCKQLQRVDGKIEMGLKVKWDVPNIFQYLVSVHPELEKLRDRLFREDREPTRDEKIALGQRFEQLLEKDRATYTQLVIEVLSNVCFEIKKNVTKDENEVMKLACLIERTGESRFEEAVFEAAKLFDDNFAFDYNGPWPPYNFVDIELRPK